MGQFTHSVYYYLKDLDQVHLACRCLPHGYMDQTLLIDDEPNKAFRSPKWSRLFLEPFRGQNLSKKSAMVRPCISIVANVEGFAVCKDGLCPFHSYYAIFEVVV